MGRVPVVRLLAVILLLSVVVDVRAPPPGDAPAASLPSVLPSPTLSDARFLPEAPSDAEASAEPAYPSDAGPRPLGSPEDPSLTLANAIANHGFDDAWALGYEGAGVRMAVVDEGVDFGHLDLQGTQATVTDTRSPYYGWPIVYDPKSLLTYLTTGYPDGTWYANTTRVGTGPFEVTHTITVDGTNDFGDRERWGVDPRDNSAGAPGGDKEDYDLTDLYVTRDDNNWYLGFPVFLRTRNASFVLLIDTDNETSGAYTAPRGHPIDANTSHADRVNDVAWSPNGTWLATVGGDRLVRIWDRAGALVRTMFGHAAEPLSVAWSPDGTKVASADKDRLRLWDALSGSLIRETQYVPSGDPTITENGILAFSANGTWLAAATFKYVHVFNVATGAKFGSIWPANTDVNGLTFSPAGDQLAVALGDNSIRVYSMVPATFSTAVPATPLFTLAGHTQPVLEVSWSPDGTKIVSGGRDDTARLWDVATRMQIRSMPNHLSWVLAADWAPGSAQFVTSSRGLPPGVAPSFIVWDSAGNIVCRRDQAKAIGGVDWSFQNEIATGSEDLTARSWTPGCNPIRTFTAHRPDFAIVVHGFTRFSDRESKYIPGTEIAEWFRWDEPTGAWVNASILDVGGRQAAFQFGEALFNEFAIPRSRLPGDPSAIAVELYSAHENGSKAQDTVPSDRNVDFRNTDFTAGRTSLSSFAWRRIQEYRVSGLSSASGAFHFGFHPGPSVQRRYGALGVLVADPVQAGNYTDVYLDMNDDKVFDASDIRVTKASPTAAIDNYDAVAGGPGQDGYPDVSAGMVYFISDGTNPIPYSSRVVDRKSAQGALMRTPAAGDLVAFAGEFGVAAGTQLLSEHGTRIASALVAQGRLPAGLVGTAKDARLIGIMNGLSDPVEAWTFAVEGYDGRADSGDEATVVVSAFNFPTIHHDGWDVYSRTADYLSTQASNGTAVFVASAGDAGFGYGSVLAPASGPSVIAAGRAGDFSVLSSVVGGPEGPNPHFRNPAVPGSRGPSAQGFVKPELLAVDTAILAIPLHSASEGSSAIASSPMVGSDVSAAVVAGAAALVQQAFTANRGRVPKIDEVRNLLLSGADDTGHDVLTQGSGFLNVSRSVRLAARTADAGLEVSPSTWHPGAYEGVTYRGFTRLMAPGDWEVANFDVANRGTSAITANAEAVTYTRLGGYVHANVTRADLYEPEGDIALWVNDTGVWKVDGATLTAWEVAPPVPGLWANADLVKVTAYSNYSLLTYKVGTTFLTNYSYTLKAYDWTIDWANWPPAVDPFPAPAIFPAELNTVGATFHQSNVLEVRAAFPASALHEGLVISLEAVDATLAVMGLPWTFEFEFYARTPWSWVGGLTPSFNVPAGGTTSLLANLSVPANADIGAHEGAILIQDLTHGVNTTIPILVNVGAGAPRLSFGGDLLSSDLYDNSRLFGGYDKALASATRLARPTLGDWRFYFFDIPNQGIFEAPVGYKVLVEYAWVDAPSDVDIFAFGRTTADVASQGNGGWYGPFTLKQVGKSEELDKPEFRTVTGGAGEVVAYDLVSGLNVIALRAFAVRGLEVSVRLVAGEAGWVNTATGIDVSTRTLAGRAPFTFLSNMDLPGLRASALGPAQTTAFADLEIPQDVQAWWNFPGWGEWMFRASFSYEFIVERALILEVAVQGKVDVEDLDMAVFRDVNDNGEIDFDEYSVIDCVTVAPGLCEGGSIWNYNADGDADERVKWVNPPDGRYFVKVLGFTVLANPGHFDLQVSVTLATGRGYEIPEAPKPAEVVNGTTPLGAFTRVTMNLTWDFPFDAKDDRYGGAVQLGLPNAPGVIVVPVTVLLDRKPPEIVGMKVNALGGRVDSTDNRTTNDRLPQLAVSVQDLDWGQLEKASVQLVLDGDDLTPIAGIGITYTARAGRQGLWEGTLTLTPPAPLGEGTHALDATIGDRAGNTNTTRFLFAIDTAAPVLAITSPRLLHTQSDTYTLTGSVDAGSALNVRGAWTVVASGTFAIDVPLLEGTNLLTITAADWFEIDASGNPVAGNSVTDALTVVRDLTPPEFVRWGADPTGTTRESEAVITGQVRDFLAASEPGRVDDLALTVGGQPVAILADGSFRTVVPLAEGSNAITLAVTDLAGNTATQTITVVRDTVAPTLSASVREGATVYQERATVAGATEAGAFVTVNGISVAVTDGSFEATVVLSPGRNRIVVQAFDSAGNFATQSLEVTYQPETGVSSALAAGLVVAGVLLGALIAFFLVRAGVRIPGLTRRPPEEAAPPEGPVEPESTMEEPAAEAPPTEVAEDPRVARLRSAYEQGRITKDVYEENLRRLKGTGGA